MNDVAFWGEPISVYTRAMALDDGQLVDVSEWAREVGIRYPVAVTRAVWESVIAWTESDEQRKPCGTGQSERGRGHDVVWMLRCAMSRCRGDRLLYRVLRVPREGRGVQARAVELQAVCGPGDTLDPVVTVMLPDED